MLVNTYLLNCNISGQHSNTLSCVNNKKTSVQFVIEYRALQNIKGQYYNNDNNYSTPALQRFKIKKQ